MLRIRSTLLITLCVAATGAAPAAAQVATLRPPASDPAVRDPSLVAFRAEISRAIVRRDSTALYRLLAPNVRIDFGSNGGLAAFKREWRPERANSRVWSVLDAATSYVGRLDGNTYTTPWMFAYFPENVDAFRHAVVPHAAIVRARPDARSPRLARVQHVILPVVSWDAVRDRQPGQSRRWIQVRLRDGRRGYVVQQNLYNPVGYRAIFNKVNGRWQITALVQGD